MKWIVYGTTTVSVSVRVEADDEDEARDAAVDLFNGLTSYVGNGGTDKLVGVSDEEVSISPEDGFEIADVEPAEVAEAGGAL